MTSTEWKRKGVLIGALAICLCSHVLYATERLRPEHDLTYLGAFRVPVDSSANHSWAWVESSLTYNPIDKTLISPSMRVPDHANFGKITEFTIPKPKISKGHDLGDLNVARTVHDWTDITAGRWNQGLEEPIVGGMAVVPARGTQKKDKIYWLTSTWFNPGKDVATLGMSDLDFSRPNGRGPWRIAGSWWHGPGLPSSRTSRYMFTIPQAWADRYVHGYSIATGENKPNGFGSRGACIYAVRPWETDEPPGAGADIDSIELLCPGMDFAHRRNYDRSSWDYFSYVDKQLSAVWVDVNGRGAVMFVGSVATLTANDTGDCDPAVENCEYYKSDLPGDNEDLVTPYTSPGKSPDACPSSGDFQGEPYYRVLWLYGVDDLQAVVQGKKNSYEPQPYAIYNLENYLWMEGRCALNHIGGIAYDAAGQRIFVAELKVDDSVSQYDITPIIHVFKVSNSGRPADTIPPFPPANVVSDGNGGLSWDAARDADGPILYIVKRNGKPIGVTTKTEYQDDVYDKYLHPEKHQYTVEARDVVNNRSFSSGGRQKKSR